MAVMSDLEVLLQDRLEETRGFPGQFWLVQDELRPLINEGLNEAALITGEPQVRISTLFTLPASQRFNSLPAGSICLLRMEGQEFIQKTTMFDLDTMNPTWESDPAGPVPLYWFPYGLTQFGIYPLLQAPVQVFLTVVQLPILTWRPFTGAEQIPYQQEYNEGIVQYAAHAARLKEGGKDFVDSMQQYDSFLSKMTELSKFMDRRNVWRFTRSVGARATITDIQEK
jgi:hypothetical protein